MSEEVTRIIDTELDPIAFGYPRYDLDETELGILVDKLFRELPLNTLPDGIKFVSTEFGPGSVFGNIARSIEKQVFVEEFGNDESVMAQEYGDYEDSSRFWVIFDLEQKTPVGALRVIENSPYGLKTLNDLQEILTLAPNDVASHHSMVLDKVWDVGTVAVVPEFRGIEYEFLPSLTLYRSLYDRGVELGIDHFISIIDEKEEGNLRLLGMPFRPIMDSESFYYLGSEHSTALYSRVDDLATGVHLKMDEVEADRSSGIGRLIYQSCDAMHNGHIVDQFRVDLPIQQD